MNLKRKYILKYTKRKLIQVITLIMIIAILFIIENYLTSGSLTINYIKKNLIKIAILSLPILVIILFYIFNIIHFHKIIKKQEKAYNINFNDDNNAIPLSKKYLNYLSDEWYIHSSKGAFYYKDIKAIILSKIQVYRINGKKSNLVIIQTIKNKKYYVLVERPLHYEQIKEWHKNLMEKGRGNKKTKKTK